MLTDVRTLLKSRKTLAGAPLALLLMSATAMIFVSQINQDASKREQKLQIDVAFIIHGSKNITSPPREKTYQDALDWTKKIIKAFGEIGINKTRVGLILYAEKPKLMFNFTDKPEKGDVMAAVEEASSPPVLGNKTNTGRALWLALMTLVNGTREEALKKFFVFSDRPPDDNPLAPAMAIKKKKVDLYGLGQTTAPYSDWYISDYSLDSLYAMLSAGPFKGLGKEEKYNSFQEELSPITASNPPQDSGATKVNQVVTTTIPGKTNEQVQNLFSPKSSNNVSNEVAKMGGSTSESPRKALDSQNMIASVISKVHQTNKENLVKTTYGKDASLIVTANGVKSRKSVGRYSAGTDISYKTTEFGTVIGGIKSPGESQFSVIKPGDEQGKENSILRSNVGQYQRQRHKWLTSRTKKFYQ